MGSGGLSSGMGGQVLNGLVNSMSGRGGATGGMGGMGGMGGSSMLGNLAMAAFKQFTQGGSSSTSSARGFSGATGGLGSTGMGGLGSTGMGGLGSTGMGGLGSTGMGSTGMGGGGGGGDAMGFPQSFDPAQANRQALVFVRAMINAAKADGHIDDDEKRKIVDKLSDVDQQAIEFVRQEMAKPLNMDFLSDVDSSMASQVYSISLMAIELDTMEELNYLKQLAQRMGMDPQTVNSIHQQLGVAPIY